MPVNSTHILKRSLPYSYIHSLIRLPFSRMQTTWSGPIVPHANLSGRYFVMHTVLDFGPPNICCTYRCIPSPCTHHIALSYASYIRSSQLMPAVASAFGLRACTTRSVYPAMTAYGLFLHNFTRRRSGSDELRENGNFCTCVFPMCFQ